MLLASALLRWRVLLHAIRCHVVRSASSGELPQSNVRNSCRPPESRTSLSNWFARPSGRPSALRGRGSPCVQPLPRTMSAVWPPPVEALSWRGDTAQIGQTLVHVARGPLHPLAIRLRSPAVQHPSGRLHRDVRCWWQRPSTEPGAQPLAVRLKEGHFSRQSVARKPRGFPGNEKRGTTGWLRSRVFKMPSNFANGSTGKPCDDRFCHVGSSESLPSGAVIAQLVPVRRVQVW